MKNGKKPTRAQKELMKANRMKPENWLVVKDTPRELECVSRSSVDKGTNKTRTISK